MLLKKNYAKEKTILPTLSPRLVGEYSFAGNLATLLSASSVTTQNARYGQFLWETAQPTKDSSGRIIHTQAKQSIACLLPYRVIVTSGHRVTVSDASGTTVFQENDIADPFLWCKELLESFLQSATSATANASVLRHLSIVGAVAYDAARHFENLPQLPVTQNEPDMCWIIPQLLLVQTPSENKSNNEVSVWQLFDDLDHELLTRTLERIESASLKSDRSPSMTKTHAGIVPLFDAQAFAKNVLKAKEFILDGDAFQIVVANKFTIDTDFKESLGFYSALKSQNQSPYHFFLNTGDCELIGASPEVFLRGAGAEDGLYKLHTRLVAGTAPSNAEDKLRNDPKEKAEHIMLVDHMRNDLGKVSRIGSVHVKDLMSVERYRDVLHLVSEVEGTLREQETPLSALRASFPIATLTGTPKIRAMEIISELEVSPRGFFGGAVCRMGLNGDFDSTVIIRSLVKHNEGAHIWAGCGIVLDSDPEREFQESYLKAKALLDLFEPSQSASSVSSLSNEVTL